MGESAAQTVVEIEEARRGLQRDLERIEERLPAPLRSVKRLVGIAVGGGVGGVVFWFVVRRAKARRKNKSRQPTEVVLRLVVDRDSGATTVEPMQ